MPYTLATNHADNLVAYFRHGIKELGKEYPFFPAYRYNAGAKEDGENNQRKDICVRHRFHRILRNHIDQHFHKGRGLLNFRCSGCAHIQAYPRMNQHSSAKPKKNSDGGSSHIHNKGLHANTAQFLQISQTGHPGNKRG